MTELAERQLLAAAAGLLDLGRGIEALSRPLTVLAHAGLLAPLAVPVPAAGWLALLAAALAGLGGAYLGARVGFDAALFRGLAPGAENLARLDAALTGLGLLPAAKAGRPLDVRLAGARRLLRWQAALLAVQAGALALAGAAGL